MMDVVRYVGHRGCSESQYQDQLKNAGGAVVDIVSAERNVTLRFSRDEHPVQVPMTAEVRDLVDLAVSVYIADELVERKSASDAWTRTFQMTVPVRDLDRWNAMGDDLRRTLWFLAQDRYQFLFLERSGLPRGIRHRRSLPRGYDAVCLFSGGIDSLLGAHELLAQGKKVLLVGHQAEPITAAAQKRLARELRGRFPGQATLVQCRVARANTRQPTFRLPSKVEDSHRPRSFLFLALAVAVARAARVSEIYMPENGLIALNPPLQVSRVGSHSTRTAHPIFLTRFLDTLRIGGIYEGEIRNPFLYQSKSDMLRCLDPSLIELVQRSVSCSHPSRYQDEGVRHCGYCVPCLYRRAAIMVCGLDRDTDYAFDVWRTRGSLRQKRKLTAYAQADVRAMVPFAQRVAASSQAELELLVLSHGYFPPDIGEQIGPHASDDYTPWTEMLLRWANDFLTEVPARCVRSRARQFGFVTTKAPVR